MRLLLLLTLVLGACAPDRAQKPPPAPATRPVDDRAAARWRVAALERQVVEDQERLREVQLKYDATRDTYLTLRDAAANGAREDDRARAAARESQPYQALLTNLRDAAGQLESHGDVTPDMRITLSRLADLMQASEVRPADAEEARRWERYLGEARDQARALRHDDENAAAAANALVDAFVRVCWFWQDFDEQRSGEGARREAHLRAERELSQAARLHQRAQDELEDAKRALREHEIALREARASSRRMRDSTR